MFNCGSAHSCGNSFLLSLLPATAARNAESSNVQGDPLLYKGMRPVQDVL